MQSNQNLLLMGQASEQFGGAENRAEGILLIHPPDGTGVGSANGSTLQGTSQSL